MSTAYDPDQPPGERGTRSGESDWPAATTGGEQQYGERAEYGQTGYEGTTGPEGGTGAPAGAGAGYGSTRTGERVAVSESHEDVQFRHWWQRLTIGLGVASIVLGLLLVIWPGKTLVVAAVLLGLWLLIAGLIKLAQSAFMPEGRSGGARALQAVGGVLLILVGVLVMRNVFVSIGLLAAIVGVSWLVLGVIQLFSAFSDRFHGWYRVGEFAFGVLTVLAGLVVIIWPGISLTAIVWVTGLWLIVIGIAQLVLGWRAGQGGGAQRYGRPAVA